MRVVCVQEIIFLRGRKTQQRGGRRDKEDGDDCFRLFVSHDLDRASKRNLNLGRIRVLLKPMTTPDIVHLVLLFPTQKNLVLLFTFILLRLLRWMEQYRIPLGVTGCELEGCWAPGSTSHD